MTRTPTGNSLLQSAVEQLASLPGVGKKTALRYALHLLRQPSENVAQFCAAVSQMRVETKYCSVCNMISDTEICPICSDTHRDHSVICVVESLRDVMSIEATEEYNGVYHVLGGIISPMDGIGPDDLPIEELRRRVREQSASEVILALSTSMEGETTSYYLYKILSPTGVKITSIARGVGFGDDLEYTDQFTLGKSILNRQPFSL